MPRSVSEPAISKRQSLLLFALLLFASSACTAQTRNWDYDHYRVVEADDDATDPKWAEYLQSQLDRRNGHFSTAGNTPGARTLEIIVDQDPTMHDDYAFRWQNNRLTLQAKEHETMLWLIYQTIAWMGTNDAQLRTDDLPPAVLDFTSEASDKFDFAYRGIYSPTNNDPEFMALDASHNVDYDWGLWGHNLRKTLTDTGDETLYAYHNGKRDERQFCFSSEQLYHQLEHYILDNYGDGNQRTTTEEASSSRFCIMPEDNDIVCLCAACRRAGNTPWNATPAVVSMLERLARRFPAHLFFTTAYLTTETPHTERMAANCGVIISAIYLPLNYQLQSAQRKAFEAKVSAWSAVTDRIYVWDYMRNFDDYLTPFPVIGILQKRLELYQSLGISGVFFNGSGYDYATLDDMQTFVISALLKHNDTLVLADLITKYFARFYPRSGSVIRDYYLRLEERVAQNNSELNYYGGIDDAINSYLTPEEFEAFRLRLDSISKSIDGEERARLNKLLTALNFTSLELMRTPQGIAYNANRTAERLVDLSEHTAFKEMSNYKEAGGSLADYLQDWQQYGARTSTPTGMIRHRPTFRRSSDDHSIPTQLTDGICGFPSDYHTAWLLFDNEEVWTDMRFDHPCTLIIEAGFLYAPKWRIGLPSEFSVTLNGHAPLKAYFPSHIEPFTKVNPRIELRITEGDSLRITIKPNATPRVRVACDEIEIYEKK